ncbi:hypothetical protein R6Q59_033493 [Mikania micrantha]
MFYPNNSKPLVHRSLISTNEKLNYIGDKCNDFSPPTTVFCDVIQRLTPALPITSGKHSRTSHSSWCIASLSSIGDWWCGGDGLAVRRKREIKMFTKRFLLVLALVLALTSEIRMAKELSSNHQSDLKDLIYDNDDPRYYMDALQVRWFINRRLRQTAYTLPPGIPQPRSYPLPPNVPCCGSQAKPVHKQAHEAQPHN